MVKNRLHLRILDYKTVELLKVLPVVRLIMLLVVWLIMLLVVLLAISVRVVLVTGGPQMKPSIVRL